MSSKDKAKAKAALASRVPEDAPNVPGPTDNPAANLLIADIIVRVGTIFLRNSVEKALLKDRYGKPLAKKIVKQRSTPHKLAAAGLSRIAMGSVPGAALVGVGLVAKTVFERRRASRLAKALGDQQLLKAAERD